MKRPHRDSPSLDFKALLAWIVVGLFAGTSLVAQARPLQPLDDEVLIASPSIHQVVQGVSLTFPAALFLSLREVREGVDFRIRVAVDLADLQRNIDRVLDAFPLPRDRCAHPGLGNQVVNLSKKDLVHENGLAKLDFEGDLELWTCPRWRDRPDLEQDFSGLATFRLGLEPGGGLVLSLVKANVRPTGPLGGLLQRILDGLGIDLGSWLRREVERATGADLWRLAVPEPLQVFRPQLEEASFIDNAGSLAASLVASIHLDEHSLDEWSSGGLP